MKSQTKIKKVMTTTTVLSYNNMHQCLVRVANAWNAFDRLSLLFCVAASSTTLNDSY
jgi:hypothetical protein